MPKSTSFVLDDHFDRFVEQQIEQGRYGSRSEVIRAGLRLLEEKETRLETLRKALIEGEQSGPSRTFDVDEFLARQKRERQRARSARR